MPAAKHDLDRSWGIWVFKKDRDQKTTNDSWDGGRMRKVFEFATAEDFWRFSLAVRPVGELPDGSDIYCFDNNFEPSWEKVNGGEWRFILDRREGNSVHEQNNSQVWMQSCLCAIGEMFERSEGILGVVVNYRRHQAKFFLWTRALDEPAAKSLGKDIREYLKLGQGTKLEYFAHEELLRNNKAVAKYIA